jgi:predicted RNA binding protein YcfA (HicA-like mRNA interferase family)
MPGGLPTVTAEEVIRALERAGLRIVRECANHTILWKEGLTRPVPVRRHKGAMRRGHVRTIITQAGLTVDEFIRHLG